MIRINGRELPWIEGQTVEAILTEQGFSLERIAVEKNGMILPKACYGTELLKDEDRLEVVSFVGGG